MMHDLVRWISNALVCWAALVGTASVVVHSRVPWRASVMGVHLMAYMSVFAAVLLLAVIRILFGELWWFELVRLAVFAGVPVVMTWRLVLQIRARRLPTGPEPDPGQRP